MTGSRGESEIARNRSLDSGLLVYPPSVLPQPTTYCRMTPVLYHVLAVHPTQRTPLSLSRLTPPSLRAARDSYSSTSGAHIRMTLGGEAHGMMGNRRRGKTNKMKEMTSGGVEGTFSFSSLELRLVGFLLASGVIWSRRPSVCLVASSSAWLYSVRLRSARDHGYGSFTIGHLQYSRVEAPHRARGRMGTGHAGRGHDDKVCWSSRSAAPASAIPPTPPLPALASVSARGDVVSAGSVEPKVVEKEVVRWREAIGKSVRGFSLVITLGREQPRRLTISASWRIVKLTRIDLFASLELDGVHSSLLPPSPAFHAARALTSMRFIGVATYSACIVGILGLLGLRRWLSNLSRSCGIGIGGPGSSPGSFGGKRVDSSAVGYCGIAG
ncbi:hypothetical protein R3P38DRAFT_3222851 [Favolaschia claudopus]|uniref:Uncharacterized protein n=1 Tax=Favolaschia claudopus TaxID=2862362 RepID=A0AAV9ZYS5_9AGAR